MLDKYFDQLHIGEKWASQGRTITESDLVMFASLSGDWYPLHTDREYAAGTDFKERIAHGMLLLSVSTGLMTFGVGKVVAFYGMDKVRFVAPVFIGDTIHVESEIVEKTPKDEKRGVVTVKAEIKKQTGETAVVSIMKIVVNASALPAEKENRHDNP